jgi:hypothetical protein
VDAAMIESLWTHPTSDRSQRTHPNGDHPSIDAAKAASPTENRLPAALRHLPGAVAPAADPSPVARVALVRDPGAQPSGTAAAEAASVTLARLAVLHAEIDHLPARRGASRPVVISVTGVTTTPRTGLRRRAPPPASPA